MTLNTSSRWLGAGVNFMNRLKRFLSRFTPKCKCREPYFEVKANLLTCRNCGKPIARRSVEDGYEKANQS